MRLFFPVFFLALSCTILSGQVFFSQFPTDRQLYPRNLTTNTAQVRISGTAASALADSLVFSVNRSDGQSSRTAFHLNEFPGDSFDLAFDMEAMLQNYQFSVELKNPDSTWLAASAINVVAGDVFVVQGQSNAQAIAFNGDANIWQNNYVRCFGTSDPVNYTDQQWYMAEGNGYFSPGAVGQWALRMGSLLQENLQIPIAIVNGADPGKPIEFFQRNDALANDPATNYVRLLQRLTNASLTDHIRAVIYYQGESDGDRAEIHKSLFEALYSDWEADFQHVESYYVVQVREGCGGPSLQLREYQRAFGDYLSKMKSVTANGIAGHDGCHYNVLGYGQLGEKMYKQIAGDLYNAPTGEHLNVNVLNARYTNDTNTEITLTTDATALVAQPGSGTDFKLLGAGSTITNISVDGDKILLELGQPIYDEGASIAYSGHSGDGGGWVLNDDGYGLFSFFDVPIQNYTSLPNFDLPGIMSGSGNCLALDGQDDCVYIGAVLNNSYTKEAWINWQGGGLGNNILSGAANTAFWMPLVGSDYLLSSGHNGAWLQVFDPVPMLPHQWTHVAVSYDEGLAEMRLYRNGNLVSQAQDIPPHHDPELYVGAYVGAYTFQGKMDEVRVWDAARSQEDIRSFMCQKLTGDETGLSSYFRFDQLDGAAAYNETDKQDGQLLGFQIPGWQRSAAPLGTKSAYVYQDTNQLSLALASGDSLVLSDLQVPEFVHLYFTEEVPNVLQPADGHLVVDNARYFGLFYPNQSIDSFRLAYHYTGNPFSTVNEQNLSLLQRGSNAQPYWEKPDSSYLNLNANTIEIRGENYREYILAIRDNTLGAHNPLHEAGLVYPNPTDGPLFLKGIDVDWVFIYDARGKKCYEQNGPASLLDVSMLPTGLYLLEIRDKSSRVYNQKIVVQGD